MKELFFALRGENPKTFETAYMAWNGDLLYRNYNELKEDKRLHLIDFVDYCCTDDVKVVELTLLMNEVCFKAKIKHPELNFYPQFFKGGAKSVNADLTAEIEELGLTEEDREKIARSTWQDDIKLPCSFDKICKNLVTI